LAQKTKENEISVNRKKFVFN